MAAKEISLKLLINKDKNQILYAESGYDFVDVLLSFLTMPMGTIIRLTGKQSETGCLDNLYASVEDLDAKYLQMESCKNMLLNPKGTSDEQCRNLVVNIDDTEPTNYYLCKDASFPLGSDCMHLISASVSNKRCRCGGRVAWKIPIEKWKNGVFVKEKMRFMIRDDLQVFPACMTTTLELLQRFGIDDASVIEERNVNLGQEEVLHLLKHSLLSKKPLTDVFLPMQGTIDGETLDLKVMALDSKDMAQSHIEKEVGRDSEKTSVKLFVSKSMNKVLYAQVGEEFPDLLFSFLVFPLGFIIKCLGGCTSMGCVDNLYKSVEELGSKDCMKSEESKALLLDPKLLPYFGSTSQLIQFKQLPWKLTIFDCYHCLSRGTGITDSGSSTCSHGCKKIQVDVINPMFPDEARESRGTFMSESATFMVTDELIVTPLSTVSGISLLNQFSLPISDLDERIVSVRQDEALSLLKASLISKTVLSDVFLKKPKPLGSGSC